MQSGFKEGWVMFPMALATGGNPLLVFLATLSVGLCPAGHDGGERQLSFMPKEGRKTNGGDGRTDENRKTRPE